MELDWRIVAPNGVIGDSDAECRLVGGYGAMTLREKAFELLAVHIFI